MTLMRTLRKSVDAIGQSIGFDFQPLGDGSGICGMQIVRSRRAKSSQTRGSLVSFDYRGENVVVFVENELDYVQRELVSGRFYEEEELDILSRNFTGGTFVDIGANVGNHTVYMAKFGGADRIVSFEPNPKAFRVLDANVRLNRLVGKVELHNVGVGKEALRASIKATRFNLGSGYLTPTACGTIEIVSGDSILLNVERVDMIKIDTEGFEVDVLKGLTATVVKHNPKIFVEVDEKNRGAFTEIANSLRYKIVEEYKRYDASTNYLLDRDLEV